MELSSQRRTQASNTRVESVAAAECQHSQMWKSDNGINEVGVPDVGVVQRKTLEASPSRPQRRLAGRMGGGKKELVASTDEFLDMLEAFECHAKLLAKTLGVVLRVKRAEGDIHNQAAQARRNAGQQMCDVGYDVGMFDAVIRKRGEQYRLNGRSWGWRAAKSRDKGS